MEIKDKKVIITGAANGIGKEITKQLLAKGAYVFGLDINEESLKALKEEGRKSGEQEGWITSDDMRKHFGAKKHE